MSNLIAIAEDESARRGMGSATGLAALIVRWSQAEPSRCHMSGEAWPLFGLTVGGETYRSLNARNLGDEKAALLQFAVQRAIEARKWDWRVERWEGAFEASVVKHDCSTFVERADDTAAEALLLAYLAALAASTRQEGQ